MKQKEIKEIMERRKQIQKARNVNYREFITKQLDVATDVARMQIIEYSTDMKLPEFKQSMQALLRIAAERLIKLSAIE